MSWAMIAMLFGLTRLGRFWRGKAHLLTAWASVVLCIGVFVLQPQFLPQDSLLQWLIVAVLAMVVGEGGYFLLSVLVGKVLRRLEERTEQRKRGVES